MCEVKECLSGCCAECKYSLDIEDDRFSECEIDGEAHEVDYTCKTFEEE